MFHGDTSFPANHATQMSWIHSHFQCHLLFVDVMFVNQLQHILAYYIFQIFRHKAFILKCLIISIAPAVQPFQTRSANTLQKYAFLFTCLLPHWHVIPSPPAYQAKSRNPLKPLLFPSLNIPPLPRLVVEYSPPLTSKL